MPFSVEKQEYRVATRRWKNFDDMFIRFDITHERDRHTDTQTDRHRMARLRWGILNATCSFIVVSRTSTWCYCYGRLRLSDGAVLTRRLTESCFDAVNVRVQLTLEMHKHVSSCTVCGELRAKVRPVALRTNQRYIFSSLWAYQAACY